MKRVREGRPRSVGVALPERGSQLYADRARREEKTLRTTTGLATLLVALMAPGIARADDPTDDAGIPPPAKPSLHLEAVASTAPVPSSAPVASPAPPASPAEAGAANGAPSPTPGLTGAIAGDTTSAPNGSALGTDLAKIDEKKDLLPGDHAAIHAVDPAPVDFRPDREPLILVHGLDGSPADLQQVADRLRPGPFQQYVVCYDDMHRRTSQNGVDLAAEIRRLSQKLGPGRNMTIIAHSMGGIVTRVALNELALGPGGGIENLGRVRFIGVDNPWGGYPGPSDTGIGGVLMKIGSIFIPAGLDDMRALSFMYQGEKNAPDPAARQGLCDPVLPGNVGIELVFSKTGTTVDDYNKGDLRALQPKIMDFFTHGTLVSGDAQQVNEWKALRQANQFDAFEEHMSALAGAGKLDAAATQAGLEQYFPEFPGDHTGVLQEHPGQASLLDHLTAELTGTPAAPKPASTGAR